MQHNSIKNANVVTMSEIAARAGVLQATVSLVINGKLTGTRVSEATQQRVSQLAQEMG